MKSHFGTMIKRYHRFRNFYYKLKNLLRFRLYGIHYEQGLCVHGNVGLSIASNANVVIGSNFYMSNGNHVNPLEGNVQGNITVENGATLLIGDNTGMSSPIIWVHEKIQIGNFVNIGANVILLDSDCHSLQYQDRRKIEIDKKFSKSAPIIIEDDVLIGARCVVLKGVTIGCRSVVGAGSVVTKNIPANCIAAGNPARVIKYLE